METVSQTNEHSSVGRVFVFLYNSQFQVFENKKFKELPRSGFYIFRRFKESLGPGLRKPKRSSYEVRVRVCD